MTTLTSSEREQLARVLNERKPVLREEIRAGLKHMRVEGYEELLSGTSDAGDESLASLVTDINNAEVARDAVELQDIFAAEARLAGGYLRRVHRLRRSGSLRTSGCLSDGEALPSLPADP